MCVQTLFRKCRSCEMMIMVESRAFSTPSSQRIVLMSRWLVGSSSSRISGSANRAWASSTRNFHPGATALIGPSCSVLGHAQAEQQFAGARLGRIAAQFREVRFEVGRAHVVLFRRIGIGVDRVALLLRRPQVLVAHAARRRARGRFRARTGPASTCPGARRNRWRHCPPTARDRRRGSSSAWTCRSRWRRSVRSDCRRRT